ncbi:glutathione peroxidase [Bacteroidota bacterium]
MKILNLLLFMLITGILCKSSPQKNFHDFIVKDIKGNDFALSQLKGKKILVVNTASKCGLTPQYDDLEKLYQKYKDKNFVIVGFPANNFLNQEPGSNEQIEQFCKTEYGITFPMMEKISVKGEDIHPLYSWLTRKSENGKFNTTVKWNFQKFLIDENGELFGYVNPHVKPFNEKIINWIEETGN